MNKPLTCLPLPSDPEEVHEILLSSACTHGHSQERQNLRQPSYKTERNYRHQLTKRKVTITVITY